VGYSNIQHVLEGSFPLKTLIVLCVMKFTSWAISLGSGTSGGTLAPLLTIGSAAGALAGIALSLLFPSIGLNVEMAALIGMAAMFAGASRALLTSIIFAFETTLQPLVLLPLLGGCTAAYLVSFLLMKNTIMTEKIARRGITVPDAYGADFFERLNVMDALVEEYYAARENDSLDMLRETLSPVENEDCPSAILVVDEQQCLKGYVRLKDVRHSEPGTSGTIGSLLRPIPHVLQESSKLKDAVSLLAESGEEFIPVLSADGNKQISGVLTHKSILQAYEEARLRNFSSSRTIHLRKRGIRVMLFARDLRERRKGKMKS
jgi:hypothetical protein